MTGDLVCILTGSPVPVILRESTDKGRNQGMEGHFMS